ncbi:MAG: hypothetical protein N3B18_03230 [Desulfobacterota bacterium]|nr:hypothetical protein [Thermodesulfobacteriota bacterium]
MKQRFFLITLLLFVLLFLLQRMSLVLFAPSHVAHPYFDETVSGVLACDILEGHIRAPLFAYEYLNRSGDVLAEGLLLVPYFKLFGRSVFSTKMFALTSALITLIIWFLFLTSYQGKLSAFIFFLLYALPPLTFARLNLLGTISSHHIICPLIALQILLLFKILYSHHHQNSAVLWFFSGLIAGCGVYLFYTYIIFISFCILCFIGVYHHQLQLKNIGILCIGSIIGFSPWILRSLSSRTGSMFLKSIIKDAGIDIRAFLQNFLFSVPHSLGYNYPSRSIGIVSILFSLLILVSLCCILVFASKSINGIRLRLFKTLPPALMQALFCGLFPVFFLVCLSLSPMRVAPFEYWPFVGLFATFNEPDIIRYRWLHILFPFYFATVASALSLLAAARKTILTYVGAIITIFFSLVTVYKTATLCDRTSFGNIFLYTGFNYDQFAPKFILGDFAPPQKTAIHNLVLNYPESHRGEAYRAFGTYIGAEALKSPEPMSTLDAEFAAIPERYIKDFMYGIVRLAQDTPYEKLKPLLEYCKEKRPHMLYRLWGYRHVGYKYYPALVNEKVLLRNMPSSEQWFYKDFLDAFNRETAAYTPEKRFIQLYNAVINIDPRYQADVAAGIGMLVGAEMLFDPLQQADYPLDSSFGRTLNQPLQIAFYKGVGMGFAETLMRYWRRLMIPPDICEKQYTRGLSIEWERCRMMLSLMPRDIQPLLWQGLLEELLSSPHHPLMQSFVAQYIIPASLHHNTAH